jgi:hypothetical protein
MEQERNKKIIRDIYRSLNKIEILPTSYLNNQNIIYLQSS